MNKIDKWRDKTEKLETQRPYTRIFPDPTKQDSIYLKALTGPGAYFMIHAGFQGLESPPTRSIIFNRPASFRLLDWLVENLGGYQKIQTKEERQRLKPARCLALLDEDMDIIQTYDFTNLHHMLALGDKIRRDIADNNADVEFNIKSDRACELDEKHDGPEL